MKGLIYSVISDISYSNLSICKCFNSICCVWLLRPFDTFQVISKEISKLIAYWVIFHAFLSSADFFLKRIPSEHQTVDPDQESLGLIWVQTACQGSQQTTLVDKELSSICSKLIPTKWLIFIANFHSAFYLLYYHSYSGNSIC